MTTCIYPIWWSGGGDLTWTVLSCEKSVVRVDTVAARINATSLEEIIAKCFILPIFGWGLQGSASIVLPATWKE